uniref:NAD-dependent protein deacetylase n=1 Tax=Panagrolaimus sp. JU765 TaxID=591449 RepID=A0AC34QC30_9BILA
MNRSQSDSSLKSEDADDNFNFTDLNITLAEIEQEDIKLPFKSLEDVAAYIKVKKPKNVVFLVGAGISTAAGIPDFRSPNTGLYSNLQKFKLSCPEDIFDIRFFKRNPVPFFQLAKTIFLVDVRPTFTHYFMKLLVDKGHVRRIYSQNIDTLEYAAGINDEVIVTAHGSHRTSTCLKCRATYTQEYMENHLRHSSELIPKCTACRGVIKPDIVFFGENLPERFYDLHLQDLGDADLLFIMGTSLQVHPVAGLIEVVRSDVPRILFNLEPSGQPFLAYNSKYNKRDFFHKGTTDESCRKLAELLGWLPEIEAMMKPKQEGKDEDTKKD